MAVYRILLKKQVKKRLTALPSKEKATIAESIQFLGLNPDDERLDIKKMQGTAGYRMRVGKWRIIFERDDEIKIISVEKLGARGDVYK